MRQPVPVRMKCKTGTIVQEQFYVLRHPQRYNAMDIFHQCLQILVREYKCKCIRLYFRDIQHVFYQALQQFVVVLDDLGELPARLYVAFLGYHLRKPDYCI